MEPDVEKVLFAAAAGFSRPEERELFLDHVCKDDPRKRRDLEDLLGLQGVAETFFDAQPGVGPGERAGSSEEEGLGASIGRYRLIQRIGEGGCGVVYLAEQQEPVRRKVALKVIRLGMDTENVIARFQAERQALALMDHPNIARVFDAGATGSGRPYFVMELVDGERITDFCKEAGLDLRQRLDLFVQVCQAIQHAHQKGVIHRDIKPSNILIWKHDGVLTPKVIDFGIAKATTGETGGEGTFTRFDQFIGTPAYMSPEQAAGWTDVDTRSDVYSLGVLLYELIAGRPPFDAKRLTESGFEETRRILREVEPPPPSTVSGDGRVGDLDWIVLKAMAKERERRYDTANGLAADVLRYLSDEPLAARPPTRFYRLGKLIRRNKIIFAAGGIAIFGLLAGFGVSTLLFLREKHAREELSRLHHIAEEARQNEITLRENAEFRERVAQAAVQLGRGDFDAADRLLATVPLERTPVSLEAADCFHRVADWQFEAGHLIRAGERYSSAVHAFSHVDDSDSISISFNLLPATAALCYSGNDADYEKIRTFAIKRFSGTHHPQVAEQVLKASLLKPATKEMLRDLGEFSELVEKAVNESNGWVSQNPYLNGWFSFALGLKSYREGNQALASDWLNRALKADPWNEPMVCSSKLVLAMIEARKGNRQAAMDLIESARRPVEENLRTGLKLTQQGPFWLDWTNGKLFVDEALAALGS